MSVALLPAVAGCGGLSGSDRTGEWNSLVVQVNAQIEGIDARNTQNAEQWGKVDSLAPLGKKAAGEYDYTRREPRVSPVSPRRRGATRDTTLGCLCHEEASAGSLA